MATPNMQLTLPAVGVTVGPTWASEINTAFTSIDSHDHSSGKGVQITPSGLNINSDLPLVSNNLTQIRSARFTSQGSPLALASDLNCVYVSGVDLYYNDGSGNQVRITQSGNVAGSTGSISGLSSPASASFSGGTFTWQQAANTPAIMDGGSVILRNLTAGANGITLAPPLALGASYNITLFTLPASKKILTSDSSGNMAADYDVDGTTLEVSSNNIRVKDDGISTAKIADDAVTLAKLGADISGILQWQLFTSSGTFNVPAGVDRVLVIGCGGGGGGAGWYNDGGVNSFQGQGGRAALLSAQPLSVTPSGTVAVAIGAGGAGGSSGTTIGGSSGGTTTVGALNFFGGIAGCDASAFADSPYAFGQAGPYGGGTSPGTSGAANSGSGGGGGGSLNQAGAAGGSGQVFIFWLKP